MRKRIFENCDSLGILNDFMWQQIILKSWGFNGFGAHNAIISHNWDNLGNMMVWYNPNYMY